MSRQAGALRPREVDFSNELLERPCDQCGRPTRVTRAFAEHLDATGDTNLCDRDYRAANKRRMR